MPTAQDRSIFEAAVQILRDNDRGTYTVPTRNLYPFQWNWDSCLTALGQRHFDERRAWTEIETLLAHQWPDGMVPHIVFHTPDPGYFPGPEIWATGRPTPTSGITQPPVLGLALERLYSEARDKTLANEKIKNLLPKAAAWHRWFYAHRDPHRTGLVAILHPWESGRDNSIDWDEALARVPTEGVMAYRRRDTDHVNAAQRPTRAEYDRYVFLLQCFRNLGWDNSRLHNASPFRVVDPGFNAILIRSDEAVASLARQFGLDELAAEAEGRIAGARAAFPALWSETHGRYLPLDRVSGQPVESPSIGGLLPLLAALGTAEQLAGLANIVRTLRSKLASGVASHDPTDLRFEPRRYWRGPIWLVVNYLLVEGLRRCGHADTANGVVADSLELIHRGGFAEYYDPVDGSPLGGGQFTWTAAMVLEFLAASDRTAAAQAIP